MLWFLWDRLGFWIKLCLMIFILYFNKFCLIVTAFRPSTGLVNLVAIVIRAVCFEHSLKTAWSLMKGVILHLFAFIFYSPTPAFLRISGNIETLTEIQKKDNFFRKWIIDKMAFNHQHKQNFLFSWDSFVLPGETEARSVSRESKFKFCELLELLIMCCGCMNSWMWY